MKCSGPVLESRLDGRTGSARRGRRECVTLRRIVSVDVPLQAIGRSCRAELGRAGRGEGAGTTETTMTIFLLPWCVSITR